MKKQVQRLFSTALAIVFAISCFGITLTAEATSYDLVKEDYSTVVSTYQEIKERLSNLKSMYNCQDNAAANVYWTLTGQASSKYQDSKYYYGWQCNGFAKYVFNDLFQSGSSFGSYGSYYYYFPDATNVTLVEKNTSVDSSVAKRILSKGNIGDFIQVKRRSSGGPHSMILAGKDDNGIWIFDCNSDGKCGVKYYYQTWSTFSSKNIAMSLYHSNKYPDIGPDPDPELIIDTAYPTPFKCYPVSGSSKTTVYNRRLLAYDTGSRFISPDDLCSINAVYTNGYCQVTYPTSNGDRTEYALKSDFVSNSVTPYVYSPPQNVTSYTRSDMSQTFGSVFSTDSCTVVGQSGNKLQLIYPISNGYKLGWISRQDPLPPSDFPTPLYGYIESPSEKTIVYESLNTLGVYTDPAYGKIFVDDKCTLNTVNVSDGWIYVTYPISSGTKNGYVYMDQFIPSSSRISVFYDATVSEQTTTYRKSNMADDYGYVSVGDVITVVGKAGNKLQVIYPLDAGGYKIAWIYDTYVNKTLSDIYVESNPSKMNYLEGDNFDTSGLVIKAKYTDGSTADVTSKCSFSGYDSTPGTKTVNASFGGKDTAFTVVVNSKTLYSISVISQPNKKVFDVGENIDLSGMKVEAVFDNGTSCEVNDYYAETEELNESIGTKNVPIIYAYNDVSKSDSVTVEIKHDFGEWTIAIEPGCTQDGKKIRKCKGCGYEEEQSINAKRHDYSDTTVKPTCTEQGYTLHICLNCGDEYKDNYTDPLGHDYENTTIPPTETTQGYTLHTCSVCGDSYKDNYVDPIAYSDIDTEIDTSSDNVKDSDSDTDTESEKDTTVISLEAGNVSGKPGEEVTVDIALKNNPGIDGICFNVSYDANSMSFVRATAVENSNVKCDNDNTPLVITWEDGEETSNAERTIVQIVFCINEDAAGSVYPISLDYVPTEKYEIETNGVEIKTVSGEIVVIGDHIPGDINGDGRVNMKDVTRLHQYVNGWDVVVDEVTADVNGDGKTNMKDVTRLHQYVNGWDVVVK